MIRLKRLNNLERMICCRDASTKLQTLRQQEGFQKNQSVLRKIGIKINSLSDPQGCTEIFNSIRKQAV